MRQQDSWISLEGPASPIVLGPRGASFSLRVLVQAGNSETGPICKLRLRQNTFCVSLDASVDAGILSTFNGPPRAFWVSALIPAGTELASGIVQVGGEVCWTDGTQSALPEVLADVIRVAALPSHDPREVRDDEAPRIGIAMATCSPAPDLFARQIASIRGQDHPNWICVISDDGSPLASREAILREIGGDPRFVLLERCPKLGFYRNFERACLALPADCEAVAFCDQDDEWMPDRLSRHWAAISDEPFGCVYSDMEIVSAQGDLLSSTFWVHRKQQYGSICGLLLANVATGMTMLARRPAIDEALPFPATPGIPYHDQWVALVAARRRGLRYLPAASVRYTQHGGNHTGAMRPPKRTRTLLHEAFERSWRFLVTAILKRAPEEALRLCTTTRWIDEEPSRLRALVAALCRLPPATDADRALGRLAEQLSFGRLATCGADWRDRYRRACAIELGLGHMFATAAARLARPARSTTRIAGPKALARAQGGRPTRDGAKQAGG